jgi:hypothetical protein
MISSLSTRDQRALRWGGSVVIVALTCALLLKPWASALDAKLQRLSVERNRLAREAGIVASGAVLEQRLRNSARLARPQMKRLLASGGDAAVADFHTYVSREAVGSRLFLESAAGTGQTIGAGALRGVELQIQGVTDFAGALEMLRRLEAGPHLVLVESLRLESRSAESSPTAYIASSDLELVSLEARFTSFFLEDSLGEAASPLARHPAP